MYILKNILFGWDYIYWKNSVDSGVARVMKLPDGRVAYWRYRCTNVMDEIVNARDVLWLTCSPSKFGF
jgi:hypothetical protein